MLAWQEKAWWYQVFDWQINQPAKVDPPPKQPERESVFGRVYRPTKLVNIHCHCGRYALVRRGETVCTTCRKWR